MLAILISVEVDLRRNVGEENELLVSVCLFPYVSPKEII